MAQSGQGPAYQPEGRDGPAGSGGPGGSSRRRTSGRQLDPPDAATAPREDGRDVVYRPWATYATVREAACRWLTKLRCEHDVAEDMSAGIAEAITRQMERNPTLQAATANQLDRYAFVAARRRLKRVLADEDTHDEWNERYRASSEREGSEAERPDVMFERRELAQAIVRGTQALVGKQQTYFVCEYDLGMSREEIAERFGVTRASVDATLGRAYKAMGTWLTAQGYTFDLDVRTFRKEEA